MYKQAMRIVKVRWDLQSNCRSLLPKLPLKPEFESLLTDFYKADEISNARNYDGQLLTVDEPDETPTISTIGNMTIARGAFSKLTKATKDLRFTLFGNEGLIFRRTLQLLENNYSIFSFHACVMYDSAANRLFLIIGSAGAGKTCYMLKGIQMGLKLFSAEMGHFRIIDGKLQFYKGALVDNIRIGNLKYNYPFILDKIKLRLPKVKDEWGKKIPLEMYRFATKADKLVDPEVVIVLPHIEEGRKEHFSQQQKDYQKISRVLYENAGEKIGQSVLLYESIPYVGLDSPQAGKKRIDAVNALLNHKSVKKVVSVLSGPDDCWEGLIK